MVTLEVEALVTAEADGGSRAELYPSPLPTHP